MGEMVQFPFAGGNTGGYLATPEQGSGPGVIVIQEWWGLVDHIKDVCDRFAGEGFVALAPDLYHGKSTTSPDEAGKLIAWHHRIVAESVAGFRAALTGAKPPKNDLIVMKGSPLPHYPVANKLAEHVIEARGARIHSLRGVGVGCNAFAIESFLDEIAVAIELE